ncbi:MAG: DinB family protein [Dehalococcoidia bacterium]|nr:DinB family protein [Dehalococcoidia bacterium]
MGAAAFALDALTKERQATVSAVTGLTPEQLRWAPASGTNPIGFLLFHVFRTEDLLTHTHLASIPQVWERDGWASRWKLPPAPAGATGNGWTAQQVTAFQVSPLDELLAYGRAVRDASAHVIRSLDPTELDGSAAPSNPQMTRGRVLSMLITHEAEHHGQIELIVGLLKTGPAAGRTP